ncbi:hypothetical protein HOLleu_35803 [Holothuria leucospilota]|uniref:Uncharacterized protein n=1 Tax=Holothuria leucospilota TaxID=206669 RepID=A0A9Q0YJ30_HOLLE|nr:hypothetical protein HOLleu_35803 [Holothuria leucospilota]
MVHRQGPIYAFSPPAVFLGRSTARMLGRTPPCAMVTPLRSSIPGRCGWQAGDDGDDPGLLVVKGGVASHLEDFCRQVLQHCGQVHWGTCSDPLCVVSLAKEFVHTTHGELKSGSC